MNCFELGWRHRRSQRGRSRVGPIPDQGQGLVQPWRQPRHPIALGWRRGGFDPLHLHRRHWPSPWRRPSLAGPIPTSARWLDGVLPVGSGVRGCHVRCWLLLELLRPILLVAHFGNRKFPGQVTLRWPLAARPHLCGHHRFELWTEARSRARQSVDWLPFPGCRLPHQFFEPPRRVRGRLELPFDELRHATVPIQPACR